MLQRYAAFLGGATHEYIMSNRRAEYGPDSKVIGESLKRLFRRDKEFNEWLEKNHSGSAGNSEAPQHATVTGKGTARTVSTAS